MVRAFYFSPASRYSYLALTQMPTLERTHGVSFDWIPTVGRRLRELRGADPFQGPPLSGQYDWDYRRKDADVWAEYYGVPYREPRSVQLDARLVGLAAVAAGSFGCIREYSTALAAEIFARSSWPVDAALCLGVARSLGLDANEFEAALASRASGDELEANCQSAFAVGVFGNPTFIVGDKLFWGQDRLPLVARAIESSAA